MSTQAAATSVRTSIVVEAPIERAFSVFTEDFDKIKPREHNMLGVEVAESVFEPREGGHIYDRGVDGSECRWARVLAYEPTEPRRLQLGHQPAMADRDRPRQDERGRGAVHLRDAGAHARRTRAPQPRPPRRRLGSARDGVDSDDGWPLYLRRFAELLDRLTSGAGLGLERRPRRDPR